MSQKNSPNRPKTKLQAPDSRSDLDLPAVGSTGPRQAEAPAPRAKSGSERRDRDKRSTAGNLGGIGGALGGILGSAREDTKRGAAIVNGKIKGFFRRTSIHLLALIGGGAAASRMAASEPFASRGAMILFFYLGAICLFPRGMNLRLNSYLFPFVTSIIQLALTVAVGLPLPLAVFLAGVQSWLQGAIIRQFRIGTKWLVGIFLACAYAFDAIKFDLPYGLLLLTTACGLGAYYAAQHLDARKQGRLQEAARAADESRNPFAHFYASVGELSRKAEALPADLREQVDAIALQSNNILNCMAGDPADVQPGSRFLSRYLPPTHKLVDDYLRLSREGKGHDGIEKVLGRVDELLARLASAFREEHGSLLRNDAMQLSAELQVLDKLLKMEGK